MCAWPSRMAWAPLRWTVPLAVILGLFTICYWILLRPVYARDTDNQEGIQQWAVLLIVLIVWLAVIILIIGTWACLRRRYAAEAHENVEERLVKSREFIKHPEHLSSSVKRKLGIGEGDGSKFESSMHKVQIGDSSSDNIEQEQNSAVTVMAEEETRSRGRERSHSNLQMDGKQEKLTVEVAVHEQNKGREEGKQMPLFSRLSSRRRKKSSPEKKTTEIIALPDFSQEEKKKFIDIVSAEVTEAEPQQPGEASKRLSSFDQYLHLVHLETPDSPTKEDAPTMAINLGEHDVSRSPVLQTKVEAHNEEALKIIINPADHHNHQLPPHHTDLSQSTVVEHNLTSSKDKSPSPRPSHHTGLSQSTVVEHHLISSKDRSPSPRPSQHTGPSQSTVVEHNLTSSKDRSPSPRPSHHTGPSQSTVVEHHLISSKDRSPSPHHKDPSQSTVVEHHLTSSTDKAPPHDKSPNQSTFVEHHLTSSTNKAPPPSPSHHKGPSQSTVVEHHLASPTSQVLPEPTRAEILTKQPTEPAPTIPKKLPVLPKPLYQNSPPSRTPGSPITVPPSPLLPPRSPMLKSPARPPRQRVPQSPKLPPKGERLQSPALPPKSPLHNLQTPPSGYVTPGGRIPQSPEYIEILDDPDFTERGETVRSPRTPREDFFNDLLTAALKAEEKKRRFSLFNFDTGNIRPQLEKQKSNMEEKFWWGNHPSKQSDVNSESENELMCEENTSDTEYEIIDEDDAEEQKVKKEKVQERKENDLMASAVKGTTLGQSDEVEQCRASAEADDITGCTTGRNVPGQVTGKAFQTAEEAEGDLSSVSSISAEDLFSDADLETTEEQISAQSRLIQSSSEMKEQSPTQSHVACTSSEMKEQSPTQSHVAHTSSATEDQETKTRKSNQLHLGEIRRQDSVRSEIFLPISEAGRVVGEPMPLGQFRVLQDEPPIGRQDNSS